MIRTATILAVLALATPALADPCKDLMRRAGIAEGGNGR